MSALDPRSLEDLPNPALEAILLNLTIPQVRTLGNTPKLSNRIFGNDTQGYVLDALDASLESAPELGVQEWRQTVLRGTFSALNSNYVLLYWRRILLREFGVSRESSECAHPTARICSLVADAFRTQTELNRREFIKDQVLYRFRRAQQTPRRAALIEEVQSAPQFMHSWAALRTDMLFFMHLYDRTLVNINDMSPFLNFNMLHYASPEFCVLALPVERNGDEDDDSDSETPLRFASVDRGRRDVQVVVVLVPSIFVSHALYQSAFGSGRSLSAEIQNSSLVIDVWSAQSSGGNLSRQVNGGANRMFTLDEARTIVVPGYVPSLVFESSQRLIYAIAFNEEHVTPAAVARSSNVRSDENQLVVDVVGNSHVRIIDFNGYIVQHVVRMRADWLTLRLSAFSLVDARSRSTYFDEHRAKDLARYALLVAALPNQLVFYEGSTIYTLHHNSHAAATVENRDWLQDARVTRFDASVALSNNAGAVSGVVSRSAGGDGDEMVMFDAYVVTAVGAIEQRVIALRWVLYKSQNFAAGDPLHVAASNSLMPPRFGVSPGALIDELRRMDRRRRLLLIDGDQLRWRFWVEGAPFTSGVSLRVDQARYSTFSTENILMLVGGDRSDERQALEMSASVSLINAQRVAEATLEWSDIDVNSTVVDGNPFF